MKRSDRKRHRPEAVVARLRQAVEDPVSGVFGIPCG